MSLRMVMKRGKARSCCLSVLGIGLLIVLVGCTGTNDDTTSASDVSLPVARETETTAPDAAEQEPITVTSPAPQVPVVNEPSELHSTTDDGVSTMVGVAEGPEVEEPEVILPLLIDLGAGKCIPCKMMAPVLEGLAETKKDYFEVVFIDVWEDRSKGQEYGIRAIPTQIFYSVRGEELFRHEGFYSRKQILDKWRSLGIDVGE